MRIFSKFTLLLIVAVAVVASFILPGSDVGVNAQERGDRVNVLALDLASISSDEAAKDLLDSLFSLLFRLKEGQPFAFVFSDDFSDVCGPLVTGSEAFEQLMKRVDEKIESAPSGGGEPFDLRSALAEAYNFMSGLNASPGSSIYLVSGGPAPEGAADTLDSQVMGFIAESNWPVSILSIDGIDPGFEAVLGEVAQKTGGESFGLTVSGIEDFFGWSLTSEGRGSLERMRSASLTPDSIVEIDLDVAPGTGELVVILLRDNDRTSLSIQNPDGVESSAGDRESSHITELPNAVIWEVSKPIRGRWFLEVRGDSGDMSVSQYSSNLYALELLEAGVIPTGAPFTLIASVTTGGEHAAVDAGLLAKVTDPNGTSVEYELVDDGASGDSVALDGYFSATLPPVSLEGSYQVELQLWWPGISRRITTASSFETAVFPGLTFDMDESIELLDLDARALIGTLMVSVGPQPFAVFPRALSSSVSVNQGEAGLLEIVPQRIISADGKAFDFDVFYTPKSESLSTLTFALNIGYAGRQFSTGVDPIVVSSVPPPPPPPTPAPRPTPAPVPTTPPPPPAPEPPRQAESATAVLVTLGVVAGVIALVALGLLVYWLATPTPFGSIYTEEGQLVVDFTELHRTTMRRLMSKDVIDGHEMGVQGFEPVSFRFHRGHEVTIEPSEGDVIGTIRLNNQPVEDISEVHDGSWIGTMGRLYSFRFDVDTIS